MLLLILLHTLQHPIRMVLRILLFPLLRPHLLLHLELRRHVNASPNRRPLLDRLQPLLQLGEGLGLNTSPLGPVDPGEAAEIHDRVLAAYDPQAVASTALGGETVVEDLV